MKPLILVVEDDQSLRKVLTRFLNESGIDFNFASNLEDAVKFFEYNKKLISHIVLDYKLETPNGEVQNTSSLAQIIAGCADFNGEVFLISANPEDNESLMHIIGSKCQSIIDFGLSIKLDTINEIIRRIKKEIGK